MNDMNMQTALTYGDYLKQPVDIRQELIDGVLKIMSGANKWHVQLTFSLISLLGTFWKGKKNKYWIFHAPFDVILFPDHDDLLLSKTVVQPDIGVVKDFAKVQENKIVGVPDLLIEVVSPSNFKHDVEVKRALYEKAGVLEYWILFPKEEVINVYLLDDKEKKYKDYTTYSLEKDIEIKSEVIEGLSFNMKDLFQS